MKIKVTASPDHMGNITVAPVSLKHCVKYAAHMKEMTGHATASVFLQEGGAVEGFLEGCTPRQRRELGYGHVITFLVDSYNYGCMLGWDAHEVEL